MRFFMFFYTILMLAGSFFTLAMVPRALRDLAMSVFLIWVAFLLAGPAPG